MVRNKRVPITVRTRYQARGSPIVPLSRVPIIGSDVTSVKGAVQVVGFLSLAMFLFFAAQQVMSGNMTIGAMVAFNSLVAMANVPILTLLTMWDNWQLATVLLSRLNDIFESEPEQGSDHSHLQPVRTLEGRVEFENVSFQYGGPDSPKILENISIEIPSGKCVAIVGRSGSGKTTLVKCLTGMQKVTEGKITFDGVEQKNSAITISVVRLVSSCRRIICLTTRSQRTLRLVKRNLTWNVSPGQPRLLVPTNSFNGCH